MRSILPLLLAAVLMLLPGCADNASRSRLVAFDPALRHLVTTIAILPVPEAGPEQLKVWDIPETEGILHHIELSSESDVLRRALDLRRFDFAKAMTAALKERLTQAGFEVIELKQPRPAAAQDDFLSSDQVRAIAAPGTGTPGTAYLDLFAWRLGYATNGPDALGERPYLALSIRLVRPVEGSHPEIQTLYSQLLEYGSTQRSGGAFIQAPRRSFIASVEDEKQQPEVLAQGVQARFDAVAARVTHQLSGQPEPGAGAGAGM